MQRLKTRPQFQATLSGGTVSRTPHFALHRLVLGAADVAKDAVPTGPGAVLSEQASQALFVVPGCPAPQVWLGPLVPKRWAKRSVTRHTIKRQIYAVASEFDAQLQALPPAAYVVRLRAGFDRKQFVSATSEPLKQAVRAELQQLLAHATRRKAPKPAADAAVQDAG
ncbi:ribonuclease P protein component [Comamonas aquatica]|nr:ribonuclease P protein component [Comamonas aquatica]MDH0371065.1 ribonuclease P protein component [Comamonas aquatica]MDH0381601.1 ribonuclease P protein component [Comamonas aquatica]MDH0429746.1 ribonuclease P protein component [Comamonas aquatica]MDH0940412.1 ribonuclease P protein component [Comamonas aquatica]MDH1378714.1 ribonuclease P protein component [Comamonas aquatica]